MIKKKVIVIVSILLFFAIFTPLTVVIGKTFFNPTPSEVAERIKAGITDDETILAMIKGTSISRKEAEIEKTRNFLIRENISEWFCTW